MNSLDNYRRCKNCRFFEFHNLKFCYDDYDGICQHESNWLPSRGELQVLSDDSCKLFET